VILFALTLGSRGNMLAQFASLRAVALELVRPRRRKPARLGKPSNIKGLRRNQPFCFQRIALANG
jgi:hypothetical protein